MAPAGGGAAPGGALGGHVGRTRWLDTLTEAAAEAMPAPVRAYVEAGALEQVSLAEANAAWQAYRLAPHVLRDVTEVDTGTNVLGHRLATPIAVAPTAMQRAVHPQGERAMAAGRRRPAPCTW